MENGKSSLKLTIYISLAIVAAIALAFAWPRGAMAFEVGGEIFLRLLKMVVVPLVVTSVMSGILGLGDVRKLGRPGTTAISYYILTTVLAATVGMVVVNTIRPGVGTIDQETLEEIAEEGGATSARSEVLSALSGATDLPEDRIAEVFEELAIGEEGPPNLTKIFRNMLLMLFTDNLIMSAAEANLLPLIVFSVIFAGMLTTMGERVASLTKMINQVNEALMAFILLLMKVAPIGIFCLVTARFGEAQAEGEFVQMLSRTGWYVLAVLVGLAFHSLVTLSLIFWLVVRKNPYRFIHQMSQALLMAFSTASSTATLPITMDRAHSNAGLSKRSTEFVLPLGATINMDGTALYEAVAAIFIAQAIGFDLSMADQIVIVVTATLAAVGAAGIPEAGLITMVIVLNAVGLPLEYIGLILSVDWLLDRFRTAVNVLGDAVGTAVVDKTSFTKA